MPPGKIELIKSKHPSTNFNTQSKIINNEEIIIPFYSKELYCPDTLP